MPRQVRTNHQAPHHLIRLAGSVCLLFLLALLIWYSARNGYAALLASNASANNNLPAANAALGFSPGNPEAHFLVGALLEANGDLAAAMPRYQTAVALRTQDYALWVQLARARELEGDIAGAISAGKTAVSLAPFYAKPRWQLGNILVRAGQSDEGFLELRVAGAADSALLPAIIDLAWQVSRGDVRFVKRVIQPASTESYIALGQYLKKRGEVDEVIAMFSTAGGNAEVARARDQYLAELITAGKFKEAYALWTATHASDAAPGVLNNPGFEQEIDLAAPGFGWRLESKAPTLSLSLEGANPREGKSSLRIEFNGNSELGVPVITQLVLVEPHTRYQIHFALRTEELVTGALPHVIVFDAGSNGVLGRSDAFPQESHGWRDYAIDLTTADSTTATRIALQREPCSKPPCPIFGRLWLDAFNLKKL